MLNPTIELVLIVGLNVVKFHFDRILVQLFLLRHKKDEWTAYRDSRTLMQYCPSTETRLTSVFEMGTGEPRPYGRPYASI